MTGWTERFEAVHLRTTRRADVLRALETLAQARGLQPCPVDPEREARSRPDWWRVVVSPARAGWVSVYPEAIPKAREFVCNISELCACSALIAAGEPGVLWGFEVTEGGQSLALYRSDETPADGDAVARVSAVLAGLAQDSAVAGALEGVLRATGEPEARSYARLCDLLGLRDVKSVYEALAPVLLTGTPELEGYELLPFTRTGLRRSAPPLDPLDPLLPDV